MHNISVKPAIRVGWGKQSIDPKSVVMADIDGQKVIWDSKERARYEKDGKNAYVSGYFCFLKNNGKYAFFVYDDENIVGFALTKRNYRTTYCTLSAIYVSARYYSPETLREVATLLVYLIPADWLIGVSRRKLPDSYQFWDAFVDKNAAIANVKRETNRISFRSSNSTVSWRDIFFGVEIEFFGVAKDKIKLPANWNVTAEEWIFAKNPYERSYDGDIADHEVETQDGAEVRTPPLQFSEIGSIETVLSDLKAHGAAVNYSCALHVHLAMFHWGYSLMPNVVKNLEAIQETLISVLRPSIYRSCFCQKYEEDFPEKYLRQKTNLDRYLLTECKWGPFLRYGVNLSSFWNRVGSIEIRFANGSLDYGEVKNTVQLYLEIFSQLQNRKPLSADFLSGLKDRQRRLPPPLEVPEDFTAIFPLMCRLERKSIFTLFDEDAEHAEAYASGFGDWLEKLPNSILKQHKGKLRIRYRLSDKLLSIEVFFQERLIDTIEQTLSPKGIAAISQFIAKNGNAETIWIKKVRDVDYRLLNEVT